MEGAVSGFGFRVHFGVSPTVKLFFIFLLFYFFWYMEPYNNPKPETRNPLKMIMHSSPIFVMEGVTGYRLQVGFGLSPTTKLFLLFLLFYFFWYMEPYINL
jgi:hypothetical protein